jgi:hypothetical protein
MNLSPIYGTPSLLSVLLLGPTQEITGVVGNILDDNLSTYYGLYVASLSYGVVGNCSINASWRIILDRRLFVESFQAYLYVQNEVKTATSDWHAADNRSSYTISVYDEAEKVYEQTGTIAQIFDSYIGNSVNKMATSIIVSVYSPNGVFNTNISRNYLRNKEIILNGEEWTDSNIKYSFNGKKYRILKNVSEDELLRVFDGSNIICPALASTSHVYATPLRVMMLDGLKSIAGYLDE